ncbi:hypothetical protein JTB14_008734 [Gonioctena quinquepunctata]|nr:hypothetical protein JTB14_008734 [Gonioctena quinquepunctata]
MFTLDQELPTESLSNIDEEETETFIIEETEDSQTLDKDEDDGSERNDTQMSTKRTVESPPTSGDQPLKRPPVPIKKSRSSKQNKSQMDFIDYCKTQLETTDSWNEFDASAIAWAKKLKRMTPTQAIYADMLINKIINQGLLNQLTNHTAVVEHTLSPVQRYPSPTLFSPHTVLFHPVLFQLGKTKHLRQKHHQI